MTTPDPCVICGTTSGTIRSALAHWRKPVDGQPAWDFVMRCRDREACALRVHEQHKKWPLVEAKGPTPGNGKVDPNAPKSNHAAAYRQWAANAPADTLDRTVPKVTDGRPKFSEPRPMYQGEAEPEAVEPFDPTALW